MDSLKESKGFHLIKSYTCKIIPDAKSNLTAINFIQKGRISKKD